MSVLIILGGTWMIKKIVVYLFDMFICYLFAVMFAIPILNVLFIRTLMKDSLMWQKHLKLQRKRFKEKKIYDKLMKDVQQQTTRKPVKKIQE